MFSLAEIVDKLGCQIYTPVNYNPTKEVAFGFCADLMSDALMMMNTISEDGVLEHTLLITGLATNQSIRTAEMLDIEVILFVRGKVPSVPVLALAEEANITLLGTDLTMFTSSGIMHSLGMKGIADK